MIKTRLRLRLSLILALTVFPIILLSISWQYPFIFGNSLFTSADKIISDYNDNIIVAGYFTGSLGIENLSISTTYSREFYVAKFSELNQCIWLIKAGNLSQGKVTDIDIDDEGNIYLTGYYENLASFGEVTITSNGIHDIFISKISPNGDWLWANSAGGDSVDLSYSMTLGPNDKIYITGGFNNSISFGGQQILSNGYSDIFIAQCSTDGSWGWVQGLGNSNLDLGLDIFYNNGYLYTSGSFSNSVQFGTIELISSGLTDSYISKVSLEGDFVETFHIGGENHVRVDHIMVDNSVIYFAGLFKGELFLGDSFLDGHQEYDIFTGSINPSGAYEWVNSASSSESDYIEKMIVDSNGIMYLVGSYNNNIIFGDTELISQGEEDIYIASLSVEGQWDSALNAGGVDSDKGSSITSASNDILICGSFQNIAEFGNYSISSNGGSNAYFVKLSNVVNNFNDEIHLPSLNMYNFPNPFNPTTTISFNLNKLSKVDLSIYNLKGQKVKTITSEILSEGHHNYVWNGTNQKGNNVSSGVYFYKLIFNDSIYTKKLLMLK